MPQLHHRDPSIIGLLGASPHLYSRFSPITVENSHCSFEHVEGKITPTAVLKSEAFDDVETPPQTPAFLAARGKPIVENAPRELTLDIAAKPFVRPFYDMIVDGIHSHPNSVRVSDTYFRLDETLNSS
jgi:N-acetylglucosamine-6-phosphate deacetylase